MKKFLLLLLIYCPYFIYAQSDSINVPIDSVTKLITYSEVVFVDSTVSKDEMYIRARVWFAKFYESSNDVLQIDNKDLGKLVGSAKFNVSTNTAVFVMPFGSIKYNISISIKDYKYKYIITNFIHDGENSKGKDVESYGACETLINKKLSKYPEYTYVGILKDLDKNVKFIINDLKKDMKGKTKEIKEDNW